MVYGKIIFGLNYISLIKNLHGSFAKGPNADIVIENELVFAVKKSWFVIPYSLINITKW